MSAHISATNLPKIDRIGLFPLENSSLDFVYRNPTQVIHLFEYAGRIVIDSKVIEIQPGDITCIQCGSIYGIESPNPGKHWCVHYYDLPSEGDPVVELPRHTRLGASSAFYREQFQIIASLHNGSLMRSEVSPKALEARFRLKSLMLGLCNHLDQAARGKRHEAELDWDDILAWIDQHLAEPINLPALSKLANVSPSTFSKKFRKTHGAPLHQFIAHRRINKAMSLLETTTLTIYETGVAAGITDPQYFNKQFRRVAGMSPSQYRTVFRQRMMVKDQSLATKEGHWQPKSEAPEPKSPAPRKKYQPKKQPKVAGR